MNRTRENAHRLAGTLERYAEDPATVEQLAQLLNYLPEQLREDMPCLLDYIRELEGSKE